MGKKEFTELEFEKIVKDTVGYEVLVNKYRTVPIISFPEWEEQNLMTIQLEFKEHHFRIEMVATVDDGRYYVWLLGHSDKPRIGRSIEEKERAIHAMVEEIEIVLNREYIIK